MPASRLCPQCGSPIPSGASEALCPRCLLALNLAAQSYMAGDTQPPVGNQAVPPPPLEEVAKLFPQLEIIRLVGSGGMGAVYQARQPTLDRFVALKLLHTPPAKDPGFAERFAQEARALAKLNHPNIVALYESGQAGGRPYFLMEFVDGVNLRQLQQAGRLSPREALQIVPQVCDALQYAHDEGIVHRDIKPENVLIDRKGRVKVADFGLAKLMGRETAATRLTGANHTMGTPHYMAPEQVEHPLEVDHRADIFSLGVVFYELLTGELPLGKFPVPSKKVRIDVRLDEVVLRALEKEPALRYAQASELKTRVETIAGTSAMAGPPIMEAGKFKRIRGQILTGSFSLALMAVGMAINITPFQPYGLAILIWGVLLSVVATGMASLAKNSPRKLKDARDIVLINGIGLLSVMIPLALDCPWMLQTNSYILIIAACGIGIVVGVLKLFNAGSFKKRVLGEDGGGNEPSLIGKRAKFILLALLVAGIALLGVRTFLIGLYRVPTSSVSPEIPGGSLIFVFKLVRHFAPGDIIAYRFSSHEVRVGRVAEEDVVNGIVHIERRGETPQQVSAVEIVGKVVFNTRAEPVVVLPESAHPANDQDTATDAKTWLALMDKGAYAQSWDASAEIFHHAVTQAEWTSESEKIRRPLGDLLSRKLVTTQEAKTFPSMPDGAYWLAEYDTSFAGLKSAAETVTLMREKDGRWRVIGYLIRPRMEEQRAVVVAARAWLEGIDEGRYAESWSNAAGLFRDALSQKKWVAALESVRRPLGFRVFRTVDGCTTTTSLPGAPAGKYVVMQFNASFSEDKMADVETVTFVQEKDGVWRAAGYYIK